MGMSLGLGEKALDGCEAEAGVNSSFSVWQASSAPSHPACGWRQAPTAMETGKALVTEAKGLGRGR